MVYSTGAPSQERNFVYVPFPLGCYNFRTIFKSYFWLVKGNCLVDEKFWNTGVIYNKQYFFSYLVRRIKIVSLR